MGEALPRAVVSAITQSVCTGCPQPLIPNSTPHFRSQLWYKILSSLFFFSFLRSSIVSFSSPILPFDNSIYFFSFPFSDSLNNHPTLGLQLFVIHRCCLWLAFSIFYSNNVISVSDSEIRFTNSFRS